MTGTSADDRVLVEGAVAGDDAAVSALVDRWLPVVLAWCNRMCGPKVDPDDAAHDAMLVVLRRIGDLKDPEAFGSWTYGIVRRTIAGHRRKAWVRRWAPGVAAADMADSSPGPGLHHSLSERAAQVQAILEELPTKQREVLVLCDVEERTDDEAAELLGIPAGTAKSRLRAARRRFAALARRRGLDDPEAWTEGEVG